MKTRKISLALILLSVGAAGSRQSAIQNWTHTVRIGGYSLHLDRVDSIIRDATATHVFGIETDNDIPGRYDIKWIDFRIQTLTDFMKEIDENVKAVNPKCKTIAEIYPGVEQAAVRVGADVYQLYEVVDVIAHEYEPDSGNHMAASKSPLDWFEYMTGMYSFRSFARDKASWMLSYSWDGGKKIDAKEAMKNLLVAQLMAGTNCWDAKGHVMSGSNDPETRRVVFQWIAAHEKTFYSPREPIHPIGIYFSPQTRNYFPEEFMGSYKGLMNLLLQSHLEFQVITPRNLQSFKGDVIALPDARCLSRQEMDFFKSFAESGKSLIITAETGAYNERREIQRINPIHQLLGITEASQKIFSAAPKRFLYYPDCPGKKYSLETKTSFNDSAAREGSREALFYKLLSEFSREIRELSKSEPTVDVEASPFVSAQIARVNGKVHVFMANFKGLKGGRVAQQIPERNVKISFPAEQNARIYMLPFLGEVEEAKAEWSNGKAHCVIPEIKKGAVVWCE